jgi:oligopeptidase B
MNQISFSGKILCIFSILVSFNTFSQKNIIPTMEAPKAAKKNSVFKNHDDTRIDPYYWLKERENPEVIDYLNKENDYTDLFFSDVKDSKNKLFEELKGRVAQTDMSVPYISNGYEYYSRVEEGKEYPIYCRRSPNTLTEEILLDVNEVAKGHEYCAVSSLDISPDNNTLAYCVDTKSRRIYTMYFKDLTTGKISSETIEGIDAGGTWSEDNSTIFYTKKDLETLRTDKIFKHKIGTNSEKDELVFFEKDETFSTDIYKSKSKKFLIIVSYSTLTTEYQILKSENPDGKWSVFQERTRGLEYSIEHYDDLFYIVTNKDALNFRLMATPDYDTRLQTWKEVIPHRKDVLLEGIIGFKNFLVIQERKEGLLQLRMITRDRKKDFYIPMKDAAYVVYPSTNPEFDTKIFRFSYSSMTTPNTVYDYYLETGETKMLKQQPVMDPNFKVENYVTERVFVTARDGAKVPLTIVYKKGFKKSGKNPFLLYAYGSYGYSLDPSFSSTRLSLLDRGFGFAIAHIRGGQEMGRSWYENGKLLKKINTFNDFIDCGEWLVKNKYSSPKRLAAQGGSAGGLLMGAVANMAPNLFSAVIAQVPFVDVINTMLDETIPLTTSEYDEWGNPNDPIYYKYMKSYSPYDNVQAKNYPAMLVTTGLHDSQVQYWEPAKWVALLRDKKTDTNPLLLRTNMSTGHGGASGRFEVYKEIAMDYAFLFNILNVKF